MKTLVVIPARYASTRFPGKPLAKIDGKTMIQRVFEQIAKVKKVNEIVVATDDSRIYDHVLDFGGKVMMTSEYHRSGTDRCGEIVEHYPGFEVIVNVQGDEPFINPIQIEELITSFLEKASPIGTLVKKIDDIQALANPNLVKVVRGTDANALYFSRQAIPFQRDLPQENWLEKQDYYKHIGVYIFRRATLMEIVKLAPSKLEKAESLEQLRWLENGYAILTIPTEYETIGIDTPEDLEKVQGKG